MQYNNDASDNYLHLFLNIVGTIVRVAQWIHNKLTEVWPNIVLLLFIPSLMYDSQLLRKQSTSLLTRVFGPNSSKWQQNSSLVHSSRATSTAERAFQSSMRPRLPPGSGTSAQPSFKMNSLRLLRRIRASYPLARLWLQ